MAKKQISHDIDPLTGKVHLVNTRQGHPEEIATFTENQIGRAAKHIGSSLIRTILKKGK